MNTSKKWPFWLAFLAAATFIPFLGYVHLFDWDEINFAEIAREMLINENYTRMTLRFLPFWEKPPFFIWLQALSMSVFGVNEFAARFPNALCGMVTLPVLYAMGKKLYNARFGLMWAIVYFGTMLPNFYFQSGIIDPWFNLFIFLSLYFFVLGYWKKQSIEDIALAQKHWVYMLIAGAFMGLAILTKGPVAYLILCLSFFAYWVYTKFRMYVTVWQFLLFTLAMIIVSFVYYGVETAMNGPWFITEFVKYNYRLFKQPDAGHGGFPGYHFIVVFFGCFPASIFLIRGLFKQEHDYWFQKDFKFWMLILFWVVLILFTIVKSKIIHYSSLTYFPLTYIATLVLFQIDLNKSSYRHTQRWGLRTLATIIGFVLFILPFVGMNIELVQDITKHEFTKANMNADPNWTGYEALAGALLILVTFIGSGLIRKRKVMQGIVVLFIGTAITLKLAVVLSVKKIEAYSQNAAIAFFEAHAGEEAYIQPIKHKTYAHLFYGKLSPKFKPEVEDYSVESQRLAWEAKLLQGDIEYPAYFITKINNKEYMRLFEASGVEFLGEENGFLFYKREKTAE